QASEAVRAGSERERRAGSDRPIARRPEGECEADLWRINELICRVRKRLGMLTPIPAELVKALARAQGNFEGLQDDIKRYSEHDPNGDPQRRPAAQIAGPEPARDQPVAETVA